MKYAILDDDNIVVNIIESSAEQATDFNAHYVGDNIINIGDRYPDTDYSIPTDFITPTLEEQLADLQNQILTMRLGGY